MSAPVQIPSRRSQRTPQRPTYSSSSSPGSSSSSSSSSSSYHASSPAYNYPSLARSSSGFHYPGSSYAGSSFAGSPLARQVERAYPDADGAASRESVGHEGRERGEGRRQRRPSLMGSSLLQSTHTVINVGHPSGPPRLISCVRSSQGFDWNQEIFLPSYGGMGGEWERERYRGGDNRGDIVEIRLDDGEGVLPE